MTSVTMKTHPTPKIEDFGLVIFTADIADTRSIFDMIAYVLSQFPSLSEQGLSGYSAFTPAIPDPTGSSNATVGGFEMTAVLRDSSPDAMRRLWEPVLAHINATWPGRFQVASQSKSFASFLEWYKVHYDQDPAGTDIYIGSRLLDKAALTGDPDRTSALLERAANGSSIQAHLISGQGVFNARPRGGGNAVLPAWRKSYVHASM